MKTKRLLIILGVLLLLLIPATAAMAAPPLDTIVEEGETIPNDVVLLDGDLEVKAGATVDGNVTLFNGDAIIAGTVKGDLVLFNGNLDAAGSADITGDCVVLNGKFNDETELGLSCTAVAGFENLVPMLSGLENLPRLLDIPNLPNRPDIRVNVPSAASRFFTNLAEAAGRSLLLGFLAFVAASLLPNQLNQVKAAVQQKPVASGAVGLLTAVAVPSLVALLLPVSIILTFICIGLLGFPIMFALLLGLGAGALLGWITVGNLLGERISGPLKLKNRSLPVTATLGTVLLTFVIGLMGFGEGMVTFLVVCVGLGATALTKFGTKPYPLALAGIGNESKVTAVLETLPVPDVAGLKEGNE